MVKQIRLWRPPPIHPHFLAAMVGAAGVRWLPIARLLPKILAVVAGLWCVAVPAEGLCQRGVPARAPSPTAQASETASTRGDVAAGSAERVIVENAILKLIDDVSVPAEVSGTIHSLSVREGDQIAAGAILATIRSDSVAMELRKAEIELKSAEFKAANEIDIREAEKTAAVSLAELQRVQAANKRVPNSFLESEVDRYQLIYERSALGVERAKYEQQLARSEMELARQALAMQKEELERYTITAPCSGVVVSVAPQTGEWVEAGTMVAQIVNLSRLRLEGFVYVGIAGFDLEESEAIVTIANPDGDVTTRGVVTFVSPEVNPINSSTRAFIEIDNAQLQFRPGLKVEAELIVSDVAPASEASESTRSP